MNNMRIRNGWATLPLSKQKRHFVFGDIHGRYTTFMNLLEQISYDPSTDIIYSVGDLIDRGEQSVEVIEFFQNPNCHAIRGNHEQMVVNLAEWESVWMYGPNGGPATIMSLDRSGRDMPWLIKYCKSTPIMLDVGANDDPDAFRLIHAECPLHMSEIDMIVAMRQSVQVLGESQFLWGRNDVTDILAPLPSSVSVNVDRTKRSVFCGHTPTFEVVEYSNSYWIDTFRGGTMTCMNAITKEIHETEMVN